MPLTMSPVTSSGARRPGTAAVVITTSDLATCSPIGIFQTDAKGDCVYVNERWCALANLPADKIKFFYRPPESADDNGKADLEGSPEACAHCGGTGYFGRTGIFELLVISDRIRDMIRDNPNLNAIRQEAVKNGMKYLQEDGLRQVIEGKTSIQELLRVSK